MPSPPSNIGLSANSTPNSEQPAKAVKMDPTSTANDNKNGVVEKHSHDGSEETDHHIIGHKSLGVKRIEAISAQYTLLQRIILFVSIFVVAYAYGLDGTIRYTYQVSNMPSFFIVQQILCSCHFDEFLV